MQLQQQILKLFSFLKLSDEEVFSAHFVPFRSPGWDALPKKPEALSIARAIWRWLLPQVAFDRVICVGKNVAGEGIAELLGARPSGSHPLGWKGQTADSYTLGDGRSIVALPHLSRFLLFNRAACEPVLRNLFTDMIEK